MAQLRQPSKNLPQRGRFYLDQICLSSPSTAYVKLINSRSLTPKSLGEESPQLQASNPNLDSLSISTMQDFIWHNVSDWQSGMTRQTLIARAKLLNEVRQFFNHRGVIEVETPIVASAAVTDLHLDSFATSYLGKPFYLNTSPEYHMKRLLAQGSGPIYQICKVFRHEPQSNVHNPEFTMLEWYRPGYGLQRLLDEVEDLLRLFFKFEHLERLTYDYVFKKHFGISALEADHKRLAQLALEFDAVDPHHWERDEIIDFLFSTQIQPFLGLENPVAIYNYPATQAALARISPEDPRTAQRAEVFYKGVELGNGFYELCDVQEQATRFRDDLYKRQAFHKPLPHPDVRFLAALEYGLPESSGIAMGLDRIFMLALNARSISDVMTFTISNS